MSPTFSNFSPSTSSGYSIPSPDSVSTSSDPDDAWNLIPYNVSWGHEYEEYRAGILPGPEGDCIFLRSPTPLRNQRASEACKKCRERKAKVCTLLLSLLVMAQWSPAALVHRNSPFVCSLLCTRLSLRIRIRGIFGAHKHLQSSPLTTRDSGTGTQGCGGTVPSYQGRNARFPLAPLQRPHKFVLGGLYFKRRLFGRGAVAISR